MFTERASRAARDLAEGNEAALDKGRLVRDVFLLVGQHQRALGIFPAADVQDDAIFARGDGGQHGVRRRRGELRRGRGGTAATTAAAKGTPKPVASHRAAGDVQGRQGPR